MIPIPRCIPTIQIYARNHKKKPLSLTPHPSSSLLEGSPASKACSAAQHNAAEKEEESRGEAVREVSILTYNTNTNLHLHQHLHLPFCKTYIPVHPCPCPCPRYIHASVS